MHAEFEHVIHQKDMLRHNKNAALRLFIYLPLPTDVIYMAWTGEDQNQTL